ncbi:DUF3564 family protein [Paraburkholderia sp. SIMBA_054]|uniref:DUF3564 family protein n=1 Tax=Paraburkholderia sp. SIMBA_054 TaxID=3085795 RepID=UPI00397A5284
MRLTILINGPDPTVNHDYAVLWLDTGEQRWSREAHAGIDLPEWGEIHYSGDATVLSGSAGPLCVLHGLRVNRREEVSCADGTVTLSHEASYVRIAWHWRLQAVDRTRTHADSALFAGGVSGRASSPMAALTGAGATCALPGGVWRRG